jgi:hypothetical protein
MKNYRFERFSTNDVLQIPQFVVHFFVVTSAAQKDAQTRRVVQHTKFIKCTMWSMKASIALVYMVCETETTACVLYNVHCPSTTATAMLCTLK